MLKFDERNNILYRISPMAQVAVGRFFGYMLVWESYINTVKFDENKHKARFIYSNHSQWNQLVKNIRWKTKLYEGLKMKDVKEIKLV